MIATGNHIYFDSLRGAPRSLGMTDAFVVVMLDAYVGDCHVAIAPRNDRIVIRYHYEPNETGKLDL